MEAAPIINLSHLDNSPGHNRSTIGSGLYGGRNRVFDLISRNPYICQMSRNMPNLKCDPRRTLCGKSARSLLRVSNAAIRQQFCRLLFYPLPMSI